ncbi:MAG: hypothetical protein AAGA62_07535 [Bacteroidota bacterium]
MNRMSLLSFLLIWSLSTCAQWEPGSVYREYTWVTPEDGEAFLRVGGRYGYALNPGKLPAKLQQGDELLLAEEINLDKVVRAEVSLEKVLSHEDSRHLTIAINGNAPLPVPEPSWIPAPQTEYMYHTDLTVGIPLEQLRDGEPIRFKLTLDSTQRWNWPQNLIYGLTFRLYLAPAAAPPELADVPDAIPAVSYLRIANPTDAVKAEYIFVGEDVDWSGRGHQKRKHWQTHRGESHHIIGASDQATSGFAVSWDTEWLPDQENFGVQARLRYPDGNYRVTPVVGDLQLAHRPYRIKVYSPGPAPRNWVTRSGTFQQTVQIPDSIQHATGFQLLWTSWSACYSNGLFLNDHLIWSRTEDCYVYATHAPTFEVLALKYLTTGENIIKTALTPLIDGQMVHGMEVQWPGVQIKVRY